MESSTTDSPSGYQYPGVDDPTRWTVSSVVRWQAENHPQRVAIQFVDGESWNYADCAQHGISMASWLRQAGVSAGTPVAVLTDNPGLFCRCWFGLVELGAVMVAVNTGLRGESLRHQLTLASAVCVLTDVDLAGIAKAAAAVPVYPVDNVERDSVMSMDHQIDRHQARHSDSACIMFTSGTSGPSKGVEMPEAHCMLFALGTIDNLRLNSAGRYYICLPLFHANGLFMQLFACLVAGAPAVIRARFSASRWLADIRRYRITHTNMLGALAAFVAAQPATADDRDHVLEVVSAAPLPAAPEKTLRERYGVASVVPLYGMTEVNIPLYGELHSSAPGTAGKVYDKYFEVEVRDPETDDPVTDGVTGEIMVRPRQPFGFMSGYIAQPDKTLEAWRNFWFHTGDAGYRRDDGHFVFVDRIKDCIRRRGENISSYEVEQAFLKLEGITEAAAFAVPASGGEGMEDEVMVALLTHEGWVISADQDFIQLLDKVSQDLPLFAVPRYLLIVSDLPKTPTGKIRKSVLREQGITDNTWDAQAPIQ
ncbi:MAG: AMP-binding protein [Gammaproteobacteria bacterium]|nr:AMP-binding protein [Gammaproteobacteria bacterium]